MLSVTSFTVLQQRQSSALKCADLCNSMDLIAVVTEDFALSVYRTISWERIYYKKASELLDTGCTDLLLVSFSNVGKYIAVAYQSGELAVVNIESDDVHEAVYPANFAFSENSIVSLRWHQFPFTNKADFLQHSLWRFGGVNQQMRGGMRDEQELIEEKKVGPNWLDELSAQLAGSLLLSLRDNHVICGHVMGVYPLFTLDGTTMAVDRNLAPSTVFDCIELNSVVFLLYSTHSLKSIDGAVRGSLQAVSSLPLHNGLLFSSYPWTVHVTTLQLGIEQKLTTLRDITASCLRKWKEATKVVLPKLQLLQGLLDTYELQMSPVQFLYTVSLCGLWHPAAATCFSQHWAEAGIERLRSGVESVNKEVLSTLQLRAVPLVSNITLACRELLELYSTGGGGGEKVTTSKFFTLVRAAELLTLKLDETLMEARAAGEAMLLYIQFVKDCCLEAADTPDAPPSPVKPDLSLRPRYHQLLDPRKLRVELKGPASLQQAEHITATHLYAYLQDSSLPVDLMRSRLSYSVVSAASDDRLSESEREHWRHVVEMADDLAVTELFESDRSADANCAEREEFARRSFTQQIKSTSEAFKEVLSVPHNQLSEQLTRCLLAATQETPSSGDGDDIYCASKYAVRVDDHLHILCSVSALVPRMSVSVCPEEVMEGEGTSPVGNCVLSAYIVSGSDGKISTSGSSSNIAGSQLLVVLKSLPSSREDTQGTVDQLLCCRINLDPLLMAPSGRKAQSVSFGASMAVYVRPVSEEEDGSHPVSVLFTVGVTADNASEGTYLVRINLTSDLTFTPLSEDTDVILVSAIDSLPCVAYDSAIHQCRKVSLNAIASTEQHQQGLWVSGDRGVALLSLGEGRKLLVLDLESTEEEDDEDGDVGEGEAGDSDDAEEVEDD